MVCVCVCVILVVRIGASIPCVCVFSNDKTVETIAMSERMKTMVVWLWSYYRLSPLLSLNSRNLIAPECWPNVINSLSAPVHVPNWNILKRQHQLNFAVSACYSQLSIYSAVDHIFRLSSMSLSHRCLPAHTNNCQFRRLHVSICMQSKTEREHNEPLLKTIEWDWLVCYCNLFNQYLLTVVNAWRWLVPMRFVVHWNVHLKWNSIIKCAVFFSCFRRRLFAMVSRLVKKKSSQNSYIPLDMHIVPSLPPIQYRLPSRAATPQLLRRDVMLGICTQRPTRGSNFSTDAW